MDDRALEAARREAKAYADEEFEKRWKAGRGESWKKLHDLYLTKLTASAVGGETYNRGYMAGYQDGANHMKDECAKAVEPEQWKHITAELLKKKAAEIRAMPVSTPCHPRQ